MYVIKFVSRIAKKGYI